MFIGMTICAKKYAAFMDNNETCRITSSFINMYILYNYYKYYLQDL